MQQKLAYWHREKKHRNRYITPCNNRQFNLPMIKNWWWQIAESWWQKYTAVVAVSEMLTRLFPVSTFLSPFIRLFLTPPLKPCGYFTFLIMMQKVPFSPNLYTTAWKVLRNDLHDLRLNKCKLAFPSAGDVAGVGSTKTNIKMNTK